MIYYVGYLLPGEDFHFEEKYFTRPAEQELERVTKGKSVISKNTERHTVIDGGDVTEEVHIVWETEDE